MFDDNLYNLMAQLVEEHKSLYRIKKMYKVDAKQCKECKIFWEKLEKDKEDHIRELAGLIQNYFPMDKKKFYYYSKDEKKASEIKTTS
jgi:glycosyltransferase involved in cell wall biosynthesis